MLEEAGLGRGTSVPGALGLAWNSMVPLPSMDGGIVKRLTIPGWTTPSRRLMLEPTAKISRGRA